jgi:hypothetical protein
MYKAASEGIKRMMQIYKTQKRLNVEDILGRDRELLYLRTLSYTKIMQRPWQV